MFLPEGEGLSFSTGIQTGFLSKHSQVQTVCYDGARPTPDNVSDRNTLKIPGERYTMLNHCA